MNTKEINNDMEGFIKHKLALYECLNLDNGIKQILSVAEEYYKKPIFVCDSSYNVIAASPLSENVSYGIKFSKDLAYLDSSEIESMKKYKLVENIYSNPSAFSTITPDHPNNIWIFCSIRIQNTFMGHIGICYDKEQPSENAIALATAMSKVISIEMQKHAYFLNKTGMQYEYFLTDLLEEKFENLETIYSKLTVLNKTIYKYICIITISCNNAFDSTLSRKRQIEQLRSVYLNSMSFLYEDNIVLLISQNTPICLDDEKHLDLINFLSRNNLKAAISQPFTNPMDAKIYYKQALKTLKSGKLYYTDKMFFRASDMILYNIFDNCNIDELRTYILYEMNLLRQYDIDYNTELLHTLKIYIKNNRNATKTAEHLHIHRSTFFYRIKKIESILSISLDDSDKLFLLELSFSIDKYIMGDKR